MATLPIIGWIGAGRMGVPMAGFILAAGYPVLVFSRSAASRQKLVARGAREAASPAECAREADVVFSCFRTTQRCAKSRSGPEGCWPTPGRARSSSTPAPCRSRCPPRSLGRPASAASPICASRSRATPRRRSAARSPRWCRGRSRPGTRVKPVVRDLQQRAGLPGQRASEARFMKLVVNALVVNFAQAMAEALALGRKAGLDWNLMLDTLAQSTLASPWLKAKVALLKPRDFTPTMTTRLILKDIDLMLAAARANDGADAAHRRDAPAHAGGGRRGLRRRGLHGDHQARRAAVRAVDRQGGLTTRTQMAEPTRISARRRVLIVGGSLGGLIAGNLFHRMRLGRPRLRAHRRGARRARRRHHDPARPGRVRSGPRASRSRRSATASSFPAASSSTAPGNDRRRAHLLAGDDVLAPAVRAAEGGVPRRALSQRRDAGAHRAERRRGDRAFRRRRTHATATC